MTYEKHIIVGNLGDKPDLRTSPDGKAVTQFSVAVNRKRNGNKVTVWYRVSAWEKTAELCCAYLDKGAKVMVEGVTLKVSAYIDKAGQPQASLELTADRVVFLDSRDDENSVYAPSDGKPSEDIGEIPF